MTVTWQVKTLEKPSLHCPSGLPPLHCPSRHLGSVPLGWPLCSLALGRARCFAVLLVAMLCLASLYFTVLCFDNTMPCFAFLCFANAILAILCCALHCFAMPCELPNLALVCYALLSVLCLAVPLQKQPPLKKRKTQRARTMNVVYEIITRARPKHDKTHANHRK